ncbi:glycosyltransferase [Hungatella hathewayi]|uniref:glycosyltransferase n=1 Tax=Hungatella hathewayi TaxID=154046 RepID=UPI00110AF015|nr:glycosyltransferase [Hungatella hathewayi]
MKVLVMSDAHIIKDDLTNTYWCRTAIHAYDFWKRYLLAFEEVSVAARVQHMSLEDTTLYSRADGDGVHFIELPFIRGVKAYLKNYLRLKSLMKKIITDEECAIFRLPSLPTFLLLDEYKKKKRPYAIEVIADPEDAYKTNIFAKVLLKNKLRHECLKANGVSYVTKEFLEKKYPSYSIIHGRSNTYFDSYYSSIDLHTSFFAIPKNFIGIENRTIRIVHLCSAINSDIKGHTTLLHMMKELTDRGIAATLKCIGDGDRRLYYESMAQEMGISEYVQFLGLFSKKEDLREILLNSDIMVFPSQAEGLPRVLIEAMAVGLPCLSTPVNGIPELLESEFLFDPFDVNGFVEKLISLKKNPDKLNRMSEININVAKKYEVTVLQKRRRAFYLKLRCCVEKTIILNN